MLTVFIFSHQEYNYIREQGEPHVLVDVRPSVETKICLLSNATNIPIGELKNDVKLSHLKKTIKELELSGKVPVYVVCRHGNDSQKAVLQLRERLRDLSVVVKDVIGGLTAWARQIDPKFPVY
ncbi:Adenylyltransferase and sulfurtransferase MOCS3 [Lamellibrachia satsuma]|nr:Adenylyltransferase and sulfurtransferase MOCS3 [Lamellibrachia satsuma]